MTVTDKSKERIYQVMITIAMSIGIGTFTWAWNIHADVAVIKQNQLNDKNSKDTADEVLKDWSSIKSTQESHARQLSSLWEHLNKAQEKEAAALQRISRIEIKQEICCD